ncbi:hypothetical protein [Niallia sp. 03133]|uniref:hypothetical protein n=1 Tax=Niallia sp. 03133 TaxID=3458060 RepID=UPI0040451515
MKTGTKIIETINESIYFSNGKFGKPPNKMARVVTTTDYFYNEKASIRPNVTIFNIPIFMIKYN